MSTLSEIQFQVPTLNADGSAITLPLNYIALIDTVNPPVKAFAVPPANVTAAVAGLVTVTFAELGFVPVNKTPYFVEVEAQDSFGTSAPTAVLSFTYVAPLPAAPTGLKVS